MKNSLDSPHLNWFILMNIFNNDPFPLHFK